MAKRHPVMEWPFPFAEVIWRDIVSSNKWLSTKKPPSPAVVCHRGWIIVDDDDIIVIAGSLVRNEEDDWGDDKDDMYDMGDCHAIPRGCIVSIKILSKGAKV